MILTAQVLIGDHYFTVEAHVRLRLGDHLHVDGRHFFIRAPRRFERKIEVINARNAEKLLRANWE